MVDWKKVKRLKPDLCVINNVYVSEDQVVIENENEKLSFSPDDVLERRCLRCRYPNPLIYDEILGEKIQPRITKEQAYEDIIEFEKKSPEQRLEYWKKELSTCIRCFACRNACPLCVCQDECIQETRRPKYLSQKDETSEKFLFHLLRTMHLAGRCVECGECERVCPMEIPVMFIKEKNNQIMEELLNYQAGIDPDLQPPFLTYNPAESGI